MTIEIGDKVPDTQIKNQNGEHISLRDFEGKKVVLYFYPKDMTPGCTAEACDFRDQHTLYEEAGAVVIGVSSDPIEKHQKFIEKHALPFPLMSDDTHELAEAFGAVNTKKVLGKSIRLPERATFIIDESGHLTHAFRNVKVKGHVDEILNTLTGA